MSLLDYVQRDCQGSLARFRSGKESRVEQGRMRSKRAVKDMSRPPGLPFVRGRSNCGQDVTEFGHVGKPSQAFCEALSGIVNIYARGFRPKKGHRHWL